MNLKGSVALISENTTCSGHHSKNNHYGLYPMELMQQSLNAAGHEIEDGWQFERDAGLAATPMAMFYGRVQRIEDAPLWMALPEEEPLKVGR